MSKETTLTDNAADNEARHEDYTYLMEYPGATQALEAVKEYDQVEFSRYRSTFKGEVYDLLGQSDWEDRIWDYYFTLNTLLKLFAKPAVMDAARKYTSDHNIEEAADLISDLMGFFRQLDSPIYRTKLLIEDIESFPSHYSEDDCKKIAEEYRGRTAVAKSVKYRNHY